LSRAPGFQDVGRPEGLPMTTVFVVQHVHSTDDGFEDVKLVGVYSSLKKAEEAVARISHEPGFSDAPDGFHIDEYPIDRDQWVAGFATVGHS
jgi:homoserine kinase type II